MPLLGRKSLGRVEKVHTLIGAITGAHVAAILIAGGFIIFGMSELTAVGDESGLLYSPCWSKQECLNLNSPTDTTGVVRQTGQGECANGRCWCSEASCRDPRRAEPACPTSQGKCYANPPPVPLAVSIGGSRRVLDIGDYIAKVYNYGVSIAGLVAGMMFILGGFQYMTAGGDSSKVTKAKERIKDSLVGIMLVFGAYVILNTINPDTLRLQMPKVPLVRRKLFIACQYFELLKPCGERFLLIRNEGVPDSEPIDRRFRVASSSDGGGGGISTECIGKSCSRAGHDDASTRCKIPPGTTVEATNSPPPPPSPNDCRSAPVAPYQCLPCILHGDACRGSGPNQDCCGGFCVGGAIRSAAGGVGALAGSAGAGGSLFQGQCSNGNNGVQCGVDADCFSRHCADIQGSGLGGNCTSGEVGSPCDKDEDCNTGKVCIERDGIHVCVIPAPYGPCEDNDDCPSGSGCNDNRCDPKQTCASTADCANYSDRTGFPTQCWTHRNMCKVFWPGSVCAIGGNYACLSPEYGQGFCFDRGITDRNIFSASVGICVSPVGGGGCDDNSHCAPRVSPNAKCRTFDVGSGISLNFAPPKACTYAGTEGMPCVGGGQQSCNSGLVCPDRVWRCVLPPMRC